MSLQWYVVHAYSGFENQVKRALEERINRANMGDAFGEILVPTEEVVEMREKMRKHLANKSADFDIKQDAGGLVDIEFMTQAGVLLYAQQYVDCIQHTATLELINELAKVGWYSEDEAANIADAYRYFRKLKNWQNLECETDISAVPEHRDNVIAVWQRLMPAAEL